MERMFAGFGGRSLETLGGSVCVCVFYCFGRDWECYFLSEVLIYIYICFWNDLISVGMI